MSMGKKCLVFVVLMYVLMGIPTAGFCEEPNQPAYDPNDSANQFPSVTDVKLRLWLSAYDLKNQGMEDGDPVMQWVDRSSYGTIFAPRDGVAEEPHYAEVLINGVMRPAIHFEVSGQPALPDGSDRLRQVNNKGTTNPLNSGPGEELTVIAVWANSDMGGASGSYRTIIAMRASSCPWYFGQGTGGIASYGLYYVTYDAQVVYPSGGPAWSNDTFGVGLMHMNSSNVINFFQDYNGDTNVMLTQTATQNAAILGRNGPITSTEEGAGISCHDQAGVGDAEGFAGYICEIIVYSKTLSAKELTDIQAYLTDKYFREKLQPNAADPDMRLWLSAYDLRDLGMNEGDSVLQWVDKSTYGTVFAPRAEMNEEPHYAEVLINSEDITSPALAFGTNTDGSFDRLWQATNKGAANPLNSGPGDELTVIGVWANDDMAGQYATYRTIIAMRGSSNCPWYLGQGTGGIVDYGLYFVNYVSPIVWPSGGPAWTQGTFGVGLMQIDPNDVINFYQDYDGNSVVSLTQTATQDAYITGRNGPAMTDPSEGAGIGVHDQDGVGEYEPFVGYMCEIFVFSKVLSDAELYDIGEYLKENYFKFKGSYCSEYPAMDFNKDCRVDIEDFAQFSQGWLECNLVPESLCQ